MVRRISKSQSVIFLKGVGGEKRAISRGNPQYNAFVCRSTLMSHSTALSPNIYVSVRSAPCSEVSEVQLQRLGTAVPIWERMIDRQFGVTPMCSKTNEATN